MTQPLQPAQPLSDEEIADIKGYVPIKDRVPVIRRLVNDLEAAQARIKVLEEQIKP